MWKDFFYFSGSQRAGIIVLIFLIVVAVFLSVLVPALLPPPVVDTDDKAFMEEVERFNAQLLSADSLRKARRQHYAINYQRYPERFNPTNISANYERYPFDPNTLDSAGLAGLGIPSYVVSNIFRYRDKGGYFSTPEKFSTVYGLKPELYAELEEYIVIGDRMIMDMPIVKTDLPSLPVDINSADTSQLMQVNGIGRGIARSILGFRAASGGFISTVQLREIYGMTDVLFEQIYHYFVADTTLIRKININTASVNKLRAHPYLNFYQAKAIYELRRRKGKLISLDQLRHLEELNDSTLQKMAAYFSFE